LEVRLRLLQAGPKEILQGVLLAQVVQNEMGLHQGLPAGVLQVVINN